jgi:predicted glycoside hydrolase/deacetylase ChbG (UPF0249 family)
MLELAADYNCAIRFPFTGESQRELEPTYPHVPELLRQFNPRRPDTFIVDFYDEGATLEELVKILDRVQDGTSELMCHPGHVDGAFASESVYNYQRERELQILADPNIQETIQANGIKLITFDDL